MTQDPRSRRQWMRDVLYTVLPPDTPQQVIWWGKYSDQTVNLLFQMWERAEGQEFDCIPAGQSTESYAFHAMLHGISLLNGSEEIGRVPELEAAQAAFLAAHDQNLTLVELIGFIIWALNAIGCQDADSPEVGKALSEGIVLYCLLSPDDRREVNFLQGIPLD